MNRIQTVLCLIFMSLSFSGCKNPDDPANKILIEPVGSSYYYVKNQTDTDLHAEFQVPIYDRSIDSVVQIDSIIPIPRLSTTKIREDLGHFGHNPVPGDTFKNIRFFKITGGTKTLVLEINPVKNERWISTILSRDEYGYGLTEYQFVIRKDDL
ncbi:hypothetical protein ACFP1I_05400 [Dyadobacter subterraneus]|uniref:Lipoprotein n=1 Tax=Dyadobacter subterraneus TaxID=2773304 RepID=A0ABR9WGB4_9BACT|nr:hypothetical protein [Dyadobacter subterraneus]MBE9464433.1 hypothetical protein [Dyadobacter subterraneus]